MLGSLVSLFLLAVALAAIFEDSIGRKIVMELNESINSKLTVGNVSLSLIRHFPRASATLENFKLLDSHGKTLLESKEVSFTMSIWSALSDNPDIHMVTIEHGTLNLLYDANGKANYDIIKPRKTKANDKFSLKISKAVFTDLSVNYKNENKKTEVSATIKEATLKGDFTSDRYLLDIDSEWMVNSILHDHKPIMKNKPLFISGKFDINTQKGEYSIKECKTIIASNIFNIKGTIKNLKDGLDFDMYAAGDNIKIENILQLIDDKSKTGLKDIHSKGIVNITGRVNGVMNGQSNPAILIQYSLSGGEISTTKLTTPMENVSFKGQFSNGWAKNMRTSSFTLQNCKASFSGVPIGLDLSVTNLEYPMIDFAINGKLPLAKIYGLFSDYNVTGGSGYFNINKLTVKGAFADMKSVNTIQKVVANGDIDFQDAAIVYNGENVKANSGKFLVQNNIIKFENVHITGFDTNMKVEGSISNYLPFLFNADASSKLIVKTSIYVPFLNVQKILKAYSSDPNAKKSTAVNETAFSNTPYVNPLARIEGRVAVVIDRIVNKKIEAANFSGELTFDEGTMLVSGDLQAMEGDWNLEGKFSFTKGTDLIATLESNQINIKEFFRQSDNFDQNTITDKNLSGKLNSKMLMNLHWSEQGVFDKDHMHIYAALSVDNGELNRFKLLENFSKYVKVEDLRNIRFVNLRNLLEIENAKIYLPVMFLQSNAMNLTVCGEQSFKNDIDYNIKLNVGELIMKKFHLFTKSTINNPAKKDGFINAYYHLTGTIDKFTQKNDKATVMSNFTRSEIRKHKIMNALLAEFNSLPGFEEPTEWVDKGTKVTKSQPSFTVSQTTKPSGSLKSDIKSTFREAKQNLKNPLKATPAKETKKGFKDEEEDKEEYLDFKK